MKYFALLCDQDGNMRSVDTPFGVMVKSEDEAKKFVKEAKLGYTRSYETIEVFDTWQDGVKSIYKWFKEEKV